MKLISNERIPLHSWKTAIKLFIIKHIRQFYISHLNKYMRLYLSEDFIAPFILHSISTHKIIDRRKNNSCCPNMK